MNPIDIDPYSKTWQSVHEWLINARQESIDELIVIDNPIRINRLQGQIMAIDNLLNAAGEKPHE